MINFPKISLIKSSWEKIKYHTEKQFILALVFLGGSILFWLFLFTTFLYRTTSGFVIILLILSGFLWASIASFSVVFLRNSLFYFTVGGFGVFLITSFGIFNYLNLIAIPFFLASFIYARKKSDRIRKYLARFKGVYIFRKSLGILFTGIALFLAFSYYTLVVGDYIEDEPSVPRDIYQSVFAPVDYMIEKTIPAYSRGMAVDEFQEAFFDRFPLFEPLTDPEEDGFTTQRTELPGTVVADQTLEEYTYEYINTNVRAMVEPYWGIAPAFLILALFLVIRFFLYPVMWAVVGILLVVLRVFLFYNIVEIKEYKVTKKSIIFE